MPELPRAAIDAAIETLRSEWLTMGPEVAALEEAFAERSGRRHVVATSSGTAALHLACIALGIEGGRELMIPALAPRSCEGAALAAGGAATTYDVLGLDPEVELIAGSRTGRTAAVLVRHQLGFPADLGETRDRCRELGLPLIEDCRDALGARAADGAEVGGAGDHAIFSFSSARQLCGLEGGMLVTDDEAVADRVRLLRSHALTSGTWDRHRGHAETYDVIDTGFNYRMDEVRASLVRAALDRVEETAEELRDRAAELAGGVAEEGLEVLGADRLDRASPVALAVLAGEHEPRGGLRDRLGEGARGALTVQPIEGRGTPAPAAADLASRMLIVPLLEAP